MSAKSKIEVPQVRVGQVWKDNDKRIGERYLVVRKIEGDRAFCCLCDSQGYPSGLARQPVVRILLRRFRPTSTGYVLVKDATS